MGTNYYVTSRRAVKCPCCLHVDPDGTIEFHLGKSSAGWWFTYHADPNWNVGEAHQRWLEKLGEGKIVSENGVELTREQLLQIAENLDGQPVPVDSCTAFRDSAGRTWIADEFS